MDRRETLQWSGCLRSKTQVLWASKPVQSLRKASSMEVPPKIKIELPHDLAIPPLGAYPKETKPESQRDICSPRFTAASFT